MTYKTVQQYKSNIERDLLFEVITSVRKNRLSDQEVQKLSAEFLNVIKTESMESILNGLKKLGQTYQEVKRVFYLYLAEYSEQIRQNSLAVARKYLQLGDINRSLDALKGGTLYV